MEFAPHYVWKIINKFCSIFVFSLEISKFILFYFFSGKWEYHYCFSFHFSFGLKFSFK
uniref:Uncharacterized protein n=1 Tax=uncultured marine virus TaxID=186617 RepID=A0A0F7L567_9VIRU|nr:hypothetical protein [uncultured marine virus]